MSKINLNKKWTKIVCLFVAVLFLVQGIATTVNAVELGEEENNTTQGDDTVAQNDDATAQEGDETTAQGDEITVQEDDTVGKEDALDQNEVNDIISTEEIVEESDFMSTSQISSEDKRVDIHSLEELKNKFPIQIEIENHKTAKLTGNIELDNLQENQNNDIKYVIGPKDGEDKWIIRLGEHSFILGEEEIEFQNIIFTGATNSAIRTDNENLTTVNLDIKNSEFNNNVGENGGAISINSNLLGDSKIELYNCLFERNIAGKNGGAISINSNLLGDSKIELYNCLFERNIAGKNGGAIYILDTTKGSDIDFSLELRDDNKFYENQAINGGAMYLDGINLSMNASGNEHNNNIAEKNGGGAYLKNVKFISYNRGWSMTGNKAGENGGGVYFKDSVGSIDSNYNGNLEDEDEEMGLLDNKAGEKGGGIYLDNSDIDIWSTVFDGNESVNGNGGGIYIKDMIKDSSIDFDEAIFKNNKSLKGGGAIGLDFGNKKDIASKYSYIGMFNESEFKNNKSLNLLKDKEKFKLEFEKLFTIFNSISSNQIEKIRDDEIDSISINSEEFPKIKKELVELMNPSNYMVYNNHDIDMSFIKSDSEPNKPDPEKPEPERGRDSYYASSSSRKEEDKKITYDHIEYINGYEDGTVRPNDNITREEVAAIFYRVLDNNYKKRISSVENKFSGVDKNRWSNKHISTLSKGNIVKGYEDGEFKHSKDITRAEVAVMASRLNNLEVKKSDIKEVKFNDIDGHWAEEYIKSASKKGWIIGYNDGSFKPDQSITRAELVKIINNVLDRGVEEKYILKDIKGFKDLEKGKWYYRDMIEAINGHVYELDSEKLEKWLELKEFNLDM